MTWNLSRRFFKALQKTNSKKKTTHRRHPTRPQVELLEDRTLPSVLLKMLNMDPVVEEQSTGDITLATFLMEKGRSVEDYNATIRWGDGRTSTADLQEENGLVSVVDSHTYHQPGAYLIEVRLTEPKVDTEAVY